MSSERFTIKPIDCFNYNIRVTDVIMDDGIELPQSTVCMLLNNQNEDIHRLNQEVLSCHDTLVTIEALCDAVLNYDFKDVEDKADFCHMLNEMDNKDLSFFKECFEAIRGNDLKRMVSLTRECQL